MCGLSINLSSSSEIAPGNWVGDRGAVDAEWFNRVSGAPVKRQLAKDLTEQAGKFIGMPRAHAGEDLRVAGQGIQNEAPVARHGVQAGLGIQDGYPESPGRSAPSRR